MSNQLNEALGNADYLYTLIYEGKEPTNENKPHKFKVLPGGFPDIGSEIFFGETFVTEVKRELENGKGKTFILHRTKDNPEGYITGPTYNS